MKHELDGRTTAALGLALILLPATAVAEEVTNSSDASTVLDRIEVTSRVPGLQMVPQLGNGSFSPVIRGLSTSFGEPNVGFFIDSVYVGSRSALDFLLGDGIERVEVARGPQSALYGRNSFAGAINFVTRDPADHPGQSLRLGIGSDERRSVQ